MTFLTGGAGDDVISGNEGDDRFVFAGAWGNDIINENPGEGTDTLDFSAVDDGLTINLGGETTDGANTAIHQNNAFERVIGGAGIDTLRLVRETADSVKLAGNTMIWNKVAIDFENTEHLYVRLYDTDEAKRVGTIDISGAVDFSGWSLVLEAQSITVEGQVTALNISLSATYLLNIAQEFDVSNGRGDLVILHADTLRMTIDRGIGSPTQPIFTQVSTLEAVTQGAGGIYITELDGVTVGNVDMTAAGVSETAKGLKTGGGGRITLTNLAGELVVADGADDPMINATGGRIVITTEAIDIQGDIQSHRVVGGTRYSGTLALQPLSVNSDIDMALAEGDGSARFDLSEAEFDHIIEGFDDGSGARFIRDGVLVVFEGRSGINIGRVNGRHDFTIGSYVFRDTVTLRSPVLGGSFDVVGKIELAPVDAEGRVVELIFLGP